MIRWRDLPESENVEDRRGEPPQYGPLTLAQMQEQAKKRKVVDKSSTGDIQKLADEAGARDIK